jgi:hypothetical protein
MNKQINYFLNKKNSHATTLHNQKSAQKTGRDTSTENLSEFGIPKRKKPT